MSFGICGQRRPRSACASAQADHGLRCPLTESLDTTECINGEQSPDDFVFAWVELNLCILRMLEDTFLLGTAHIVKKGVIKNRRSEITILQDGTVSFFFVFFVCLFFVVFFLMQWF